MAIEGGDRAGQEIDLREHGALAHEPVRVEDPEGRADELQGERRRVVHDLEADLEGLERRPARGISEMDLHEPTGGGLEGARLRVDHHVLGGLHHSRDILES